jgi:CRP/FNR family transcriptional regulator
MIQSRYEQSRIYHPLMQEVACCDCGLDPLCQVVEYGERDLAYSEATLMRRQPIRRGELLFSEKQPFSSLFAVKSGSFKAISVDLSGNERVIGFYLPGDLIGAEAIANRVHAFAVRALEPSRVCKMDLEQFSCYGRDSERVQQALIQILGKEVALNQQVTTSLIQQNAEQRMAAFILGFARRSGLRGFSQQQFVLTMSRSDIASYLGLARETVSRVLTRFQNYGLIGLNKQIVKLLNPEGLEKVTVMR